MAFRIFPRQKSFKTALFAATRHEGGIAATEFALILPVLMLILMGTIELTNALTTKRKLLNAVQSTADLIGQQTNVTASDLSTIYLASRLTMTPLDVTTLSLGVASVRFDDLTGDPSLSWTDSYGGGMVTDPLVKATGRGEAGASIIIVSGSYTYTPLIKLIIPSNFVMNEIIYARPRTVSWVMKY